MSLMLETLTHGGTLLHTKGLGIICRITELEIGLGAIRIYLTTFTSPYKTSPKDGLGS